MLNLAKLKSFTRDADDKSETSANGHLAPANQSMSGKIPTDALLRAQMPDNEDEEEEDDEEELTFWKALKKNFRDVKKEVFREVVNYGPPYIDNERLFPENLMYECSVLKPNLLKIHNLLNMRANPNTPDEEDLNFTPLQWACRRNQLRVAQMLIEAHANVNAVNEMVRIPHDSRDIYEDYVIVFAAIGTYIAHFRMHVSTEGCWQAQAAPRARQAAHR